MTDQLAARYEGTKPFPDVGAPPRTVAGAVRIAVTLAIVIVPSAGLGVAVWLAWGHGRAAVRQAHGGHHRRSPGRPRGDGLPPR
jgi:hypothetical protein